MSSKKGKGSSSNGRDSNPKMLGVKKYDGEVVNGGAIIVRQRGTKIYAGENAGLGRDHTVYARQAGKVKFSMSRNRKYVNII